MAIVLTVPAVSTFGSRLIGLEGDPIQGVWDSVWVEGWLRGHHALFFTHQLLFPVGANLAWTTLDLPAALLEALLNPLIGLVAAYNATVLLVMAANGTAMYAFARRVGIANGGSSLAGLAFMASPFFVGEANGHLQVISAFGVPLLLSCLWGILGRPAKLSTRFVLLGALLALVTYCSEESTVFAALAGCVVVVLHPAMRRGALAQLGRRWRGWVVAGATFAVLVAPLADAALFGRLAAGNGPRTSQVAWSADVVGFFEPPPWGLFAFLRPHWHLGLNIADGTWFPGFIVLLAAVLLIVRRRALSRTERPVVQVALVGGVLAAILSLGPRLHLGGYIFAIPLPGALLAHLPVIDQIMPVRFAAITALFAALAVGVAANVVERVAHTAPRQRRHARVALLGGGIVLVAVASVAYPYPTVPLPSTPYASAVRKAGGSALFVPAFVSWSGDAAAPATFLYVDAVTGVPTPEGYVSRLPMATIARIDRSSVLRELSAMGTGAPPAPAGTSRAARDLPGYLRAEHVHSIIIFANEVSHPKSDVAWIRAHAGTHTALTRDGETDVIFLDPHRTRA